MATGQQIISSRAPQDVELTAALFRFTLNVSMPRKMIPALPASSDSPQGRFRRFARAVLAVPKREIETPEQAIARLEAEKRKIERKIAAIRKLK